MFCATVLAIRATFASLLFAATTMVMAGSANAAPTAEAFASTLGGEDRKKFQAWYSAQVFFGAAMDAYWAEVEQKRRQRRAKRRKGRSFADQDYVKELPPVYEGPKLSAALIKSWRNYRDSSEPAAKKQTEEGLPGLDVYLASAKRFFNFRPERIPEVEFKRRYAREALALGLTKDQVVRVYALETGGRGTADMQAGIHPITGKGKPISSALGYAQLLAANSINVLSKHGTSFVVRLGAKVRQERSPHRKAALQSKLNVLRRMVRTAKSVPYKWSRHRAFARTAKGQALHVMNLDGDIGPWMQVVKLADLKRMAARKGRPVLTGAEIELMNLAGPATGLEMMEKTGHDKPTSNFFSRRAYYRNTVVRGKLANGLLVALDERMQAGIKNPGAVEFLQVFDELLGVRRSEPASPPAVRAFGFATKAFQPAN